ncbi:MAG: molybdenum cofactor guanylyltransferase [Acidimicrobiia bacterium]|nr:molybdenum cofactor guanylyltransferase [Acidimicrobiia bacterium]
MSRLGGVLLTGGASVRLGVDKAGLTLDGETLADRALRALGVGCEPLVEVGPGWTSAPSVREEPVGSGPLAGLVAGADALRAVGFAGPIVLLACDLPWVDPALERLIAASPGVTAVPVDEHGRLQFVCARYSESALDRARTLLGAGERSLHGLVSGLGPDVAELRDFPPGTFADIDVPADARRAGIDLSR